MVFVIFMTTVRAILKPAACIFSPHFSVGFYNQERFQIKGGLHWCMYGTYFELCVM
jgi:hypothetical protein